VFRGRGNRTAANLHTKKGEGGGRRRDLLTGKQKQGIWRKGHLLGARREDNKGNLVGTREGKKNETLKSIAKKATPPSEERSSVTKRKSQGSVKKEKGGGKSREKKDEEKRNHTQPEILVRKKIPEG